MAIEEKLDKLIKAIEEADQKKKEKKFKLPSFSRVKGGRAKKNWITVCKIGNNNVVNFKRLQIDDQTIMEDGIPRLSTSDHVMFYKKNPIIFLPEWSVEPISPRQLFSDSITNGSHIKGYKILMSQMLKQTVDTKKGGAGWLKWVGIVLILGVVGYAIFTGGFS